MSENGAFAAPRIFRGLRRVSAAVSHACLGLAAGAFLLSLHLALGQSAGEIARFAAAFSGCVLLPGLALSALLPAARSRGEWALRGVLLGGGIAVALLLLLALGRIPQHALWAGLALGAVSAAALWARRRQVAALPREGGEMAVFSALLSALLLLMLVQYALQNPLPAPGAAGTYHVDMLWSTGNLTAVSRRFPAGDIHAVGLDLRYHYFTQALLGWIRQITGLSSFSLTFYYLPLAVAPVFAAGAALLSRRALHSRGWAALFAAALLFSGNAARDFLTAPFSSFLGFGFSFAAVFYFLCALDRLAAGAAGLLDWDTALCGLFLFLATGSKGPFAAVCLIAFGTALFCAFFALRTFRPVASRGLFLLACFAAPYVYLFVGTYGPGTGLYHIFGYLALTLYPGRSAAIVSAVSTLGSGLSWVGLIAMYAVFIALDYPWLVLGLGAAIFTVRRGAAPGAFLARVTLLFLIAWGLFFGTVTSQVGLSNIYFIYFAVPFGIAAAVGAAEDLAARLSGHRAWRRVVSVTAAVLAGALMLPAARQLARDCERLWNPPPDNRADCVSYDEYLGLLWLRDNTDPSAVVATVRFDASAPDNNYYYSAFSERPFYIEGHSYFSTGNADYRRVMEARQNLVLRAWGGDEQALSELAREGVRYLVVAAARGDSFVPGGALAACVFQNGGFAVYELIVL